MKDKKVALVLLIVLFLLFFFIKIGPSVVTEEPSEVVTQEVVQEPAQMQETVQEPEQTQELVQEYAQDEVIEAEEPAQEYAQDEVIEAEQADKTAWVDYRFRNKKLLNDHYVKHGQEMGFASAEEYEQAACAVINNPEALSKVEAEDGDMVYFVESTNEFVVLSTDGYIRTYYLPRGGKKYFDRQ